MPAYPAVAPPPPNYWTVFGHSYFQGSYGVRTANGRADSLLRSVLGLGFTDWANHSAIGAKLTKSGNQQSGWTRVLQNVTGSRNTPSPQVTDVAPFVANSGAYLLCWGINDVGQGQTTQYHTAYQQCMRTVISRCRLSSLRVSNYTGGAGTGTVAYGAGFTQTAFTQDQSSSVCYYTATATANATVTITLPTSFAGETVSICFIVDPGAVGGVVGFSGTAGVTGTLSLTGIMPAATSSVPVIKRITNLSPAQAGQTIVITVNSLDAGGAVHFDSFWMEADDPPPVIVCNTPRLTVTGYSGYTGPPVESDINTFNGYLTSLVTEFDSMVQVADLDAALQEDSTLFGSDGVHPNEWGAARVCDAILTAIGNLTVTGPHGQTAQINPPQPKKSPLIRPILSGWWYGPDTAGGAMGTAYTPVSGDMFAMPLLVSDATVTFIRWCVETITSTVATSIWVSVYDDRQWRGYPQYPYVSAMSSAYALATGAAVQMGPTSAGNGYFYSLFDPGLYWVVLKIATAGTTTMRTMMGPSMWIPALTSAGAGGTTPCAWKRSGTGAGAPESVWYLPSTTAVDNAPMVGLLAG